MQNNKSNFYDMHRDIDQNIIQEKMGMSISDIIKLFPMESFREHFWKDLNDIEAHNVMETKGLLSFVKSKIKDDDFLIQIGKPTDAPIIYLKFHIKDRYIIRQICSREDILNMPIPIIASAFAWGFLREMKEKENVQ
jgi:hypothetical protein